MLTDLELESLRITSVRALPDVGVITRPASDGELDEETAEWTPSASTEIYDGAMRVRAPATVEELRALFGDQEVTRQRFIATLPHDAPEPSIDDRLTITASSDTRLLDRRFRITAVSTGSFHIDRRCGLEVVE